MVALNLYGNVLKLLSQFSSFSFAYLLQDASLQMRLKSLEQKFEENEKSWNERMTCLQKSLDRFKKSALATGVDLELFCALRIPAGASRTFGFGGREGLFQFKPCTVEKWAALIGHGGFWSR